MIKLVTLDAAGTIIDHRWDPGGIAAQAAAALGVEFPLDKARVVYRAVAERFRPEQEELERQGDRAAIQAMWQRQMAEWLRQMGGSEKDAPETLGHFQRIAFGPRSHIFTLYEDALPAIRAIRAGGWKLGVISNWDHTLFGVLESLGVDGEFDFVLASLVFGCEKPDPRIFHKACAQAGVQPAEALHVGDDPDDDLFGATNAGLSGLLIDRSRDPSFEDRRISSLTQIPEALACLA